MNQQLTQSSYQETKYEDQSWEIVGEPPSEEKFIPMNMVVLQGTSKPQDPMFANYGGTTPEGTVERWHLPEGIAYQVETEIDSEQEKIQEQENLASQIELAKQEAYQQGVAEGRANAVEENAARFEKMESSLKVLIQDLRHGFIEQLDEIQKSAILLSLEIANKLIGHAVEINPEYLIPLVKEAIEKVGNAQIKSIKVSQQDLEFIKIIGLEKQLKEKDANWSFVADQTIKSGCVIESSAGQADFSIDAAWERIKDAVIRSSHG